MLTGLMVLAVAACTALADTVTVDGIEWKYTYLGEDSVRLDGIQTSTLSTNQLTTPAKILGNTVTSINSYCFSSRDTLTGVTISEGVRTIDGVAFWDCSALTTISLPSTLTTISGVLGSTSGLHPTSVLFPRGNSIFAISGGFLFSTTEKTLHSLLGGVNAAVVPDGVVAIPEYIGYAASITTLVIPEGVATIGPDAFGLCGFLSSVSLPESLHKIDRYAFVSCKSLTHVIIPSQVTEIGSSAFCCYSGDTGFRVEFMGGPVALGVDSFTRSSSRTMDVVFHAQAPANLAVSGLANATTVSYPKAYAAQYASVIDESKFAGYTDASTCSVEVKSAKMRSDDPAVMEVTFRVTSDKPTVKVRALAFQDGVRDVFHAVRIKSFTTNECAAIGDTITANEDHAFAWKVSDDFTNKTARLSVDVMAIEESPLTLEFVTIPASGAQPELTIARNRISSAASEDALLWVWADKDSKLRCEDSAGRLSSQRTASLYDGETLVGQKIYYPGSADFSSVIGSLAAPTVLKKLGYDVATDEQLAYAREKTGYSLNNGPYAVKK